MAKIVSRLFAISPGEEKKTTLLYALHFVFFLGQSWGALACLTLFLDNWPAEDLAFMFIGSAVIMFVVGLAYSSFADRISNFRLLMVIVVLTAIWLISVRVFLVTNGGPYGAVYPYFYLLYDLVRDVSVLHLITYTNGFFNTRSAKQAMPVILSGGLAGNMVAGFTVAILARALGMENIPLVWLAMLGVSTGIIFALQRQFGSRTEDIQASQIASKSQPKQRLPSSIRSLQEGYEYVRSSGLLRWLALAAFAMMLLMNVLMYQSSEIFQARYAGNPEGLLQFYGLFTGISSLVGVIIQAFFINRLITAVGVGNSAMIFPVVTGLAVTLLGILPNFLTAVFGSMTQITLRRAVQTPIDAILYNCLPPEVKGRSRAFILGLVIPLGALTGGILLLGVRQGWLTVTALTVAGIIISGIYIFAALRVRKSYSHAFTRLLADGEMAFLSSGQDAFTRPDPSVVSSLTERMNDSESADMTVFLAEMLYEMQGPSSFDQLDIVYRSGGPVVQSELIKLLSNDWATHPTVAAMTIEGLRSDDPRVQLAAAQTLAAQPDPLANPAVLLGFRILAVSDDDAVRAAVLPALLNGEPNDRDLAQSTLATWLSPDADGSQRALAMSVLADAGDEALLERLTPFINDPEPTVRLQALRLIGELIDETETESVRNEALRLLISFLDDPDDFVRLAALDLIGNLDDVSTGPSLWPLLNDTNFAIRRQACLAFPPTMRSELQAAVRGDNPIIAESAAFILVDKMEETRLGPTLNDTIDSLVDDMTTLLQHAEATNHYSSASGRLFSSALVDQIEEYTEQVFWLLGALCGKAEADSIHRLLVSDSEMTRANAAEALESVTSPATSRRLVQQCTSPNQLENQGDIDNRTRRGQATATADEVISCAWPEYKNGAQQPKLSPNITRFYMRGWVKATAIHVVVDEDRAQRDDAQDEGGLEDFLPKRHKVDVWNLLDTAPAEDVSTPAGAIDDALAETADDDRPIVQETVAWATARRAGEQSRKVDSTMLTIIEKVLFLKEVPFFAEMSIDQLRILAAISEESDYDTDETIVTQGEDADTLYVIVQGKAALQQTNTTARGRSTVRRLAVLERSDYFGEMSIFDSQPIGSDVVAIRPTKLLTVRQAPLLSLIELHPDLGLSLLRVLSLRLREFMSLAQDRTAGKPKQLMDLYDQFE